MDKIQILVVDDHPMFCRGLRVLLDSLADMQWVGEAHTGNEAIEAALRLQPDVILMDIQMPEINGVEATRQILHQSPHIGVLMVTMYDNDDMVFAAMQAGARGYLLKGADQDEIMRAVRAVHNGDAIFSADIARRMMKYFSAVPPGPLPPALFPELTAREREILELIADGYNNGEIAEKLVLSGKTVRNHVSNILSKLQVANRSQAVIRAREAGLGSHTD